MNSECLIMKAQHPTFNIQRPRISSVRRRVLGVVCCVLMAIPIYAAQPPTAPELRNIRALGRYGRVDLIWDQLSARKGSGVPRGDALFFEIERRGPGEKEYKRINKLLWTTNVYGDFIGKISGTYSYRVRAVFVARNNKSTSYSAWSRVVRATPHKATNGELLTEIQEASFRYFYNFRHPVSGLAREKTPVRMVETIDELTPQYIRKVRDLRDLCTTGATGMGMFNLVVGVERGFITRKEGSDWALQMLRFLDTKADRFHGAFSHWLYGDSGKSRWFAGKTDNGADIVETAFLASGVLVLREYFTGNSQDEREIRKLADTLWRGIEWNWFVTENSPGGALYWHWSPEYEWDKNHSVRGFNEAQIVYILALASPTFSVKPRSYHEGWVHKWYGQDRTEFDVPMTLGHGMGGPIFFTHYSYMGFDPKTISYRGETYFEHFRKFCKVQVKYAKSKAATFKGYGPLWGLTSSADPGGYAGHAPGKRDNGTIAPTAALASMPYVPSESLACLKVMYMKYGKILWKDFGFTDAFNLQQGWIAENIIGIDAGPIAPMIENQRTGLCWKIFMQAPEIKVAIQVMKTD